MCTSTFIGITCHHTTGDFYPILPHQPNHFPCPSVQESERETFFTKELRKLNSHHSEVAVPLKKKSPPNMDNEFFP